MTDKAMNPGESITLGDHNRGDKPPTPSAYDTVEGDDSGAGSTGCCAMVSTTIPPDRGVDYTG